MLSKSTKKKDMLLKLYKYCDAGVREYWMIDPDKRLLIKYDLVGDENLLPKINPLKGEEPVLIFDGELKINLDEINDLIEEYESIPDDE